MNTNLAKMTTLKLLILLVSVMATEVFACDFTLIRHRNTGEINPVSGKAFIAPPTTNRIDCSGFIVATVDGLPDDGRVSHPRFGLEIHKMMRIDAIYITKSVQTSGDTWYVTLTVIKKSTNINGEIYLKDACSAYRFYNQRNQISETNKYTTNDYFSEEIIGSKSFGVAANQCDEPFIIVPDEVKITMADANAIARLAKNYFANEN